MPANYTVYLIIRAGQGIENNNTIELLCDKQTIDDKENTVRHACMEYVYKMN